MPSSDRAIHQADEAETAVGVIAVLEEMIGDPASAFQSTAILYHDFTVRCRMRRIGGRTGGAPVDLPAFRRRFAMARAGMFDPADSRWQGAIDVGARLPEDMLAPFLLIARAALAGEPCPDDDALARAYGTSSPGRVRRLIDYMEKQGVVVARTDFSGRRSIGIPELGQSTAAAEG